MEWVAVDLYLGRTADMCGVFPVLLYHHRLPGGGKVPVGGGTCIREEEATSRCG